MLLVDVVAVGVLLLLVAGCRLLVACCTPLVVCWLLLVACCFGIVVYTWFRTTYQLLQCASVPFKINCVMPAADYNC